MEFKYRNVVLAAATALCVSSTAYAGGPGEESAEEAPTAAPAAAVEEETTPGVKLGDWIPGTFTGSVAGFSDYAFRGISQTRNGFAAQGGLIWHPYMGFYIGGWSSSVSFGGLQNTSTPANPVPNKAYLEQDWLAGYTGTVGDFTYDVSATYLWYPAQTHPHYSYWEFAAKGAYNFGFMTARLGFVYSPNYFNYAGNAGYILTGFSVPLPIPENRFCTLTLDANAGYTKSENALFGSDEDYFDWNAGMIVGLSEHINADLRYVDSDTGFWQNAGDARFVGGVTYSF